jgi:hypothetical protein
VLSSGWACEPWIGLTSHGVFERLCFRADGLASRDVGLGALKMACEPFLGLASRGAFEQLCFLENGLASRDVGLGALKMTCEACS